MMEKMELSEKDLKELEERLKSGKDKLEGYIRTYPTISVVVAFFLGFYISKKFNSNR